MALMTQRADDRPAGSVVLRLAAVPADRRGRAGDGTILDDQAGLKTRLYDGILVASDPSVSR